MVSKRDPNNCISKSDLERLLDLFFQEYQLEFKTVIDRERNGKQPMAERLAYLFVLSEIKKIERRLKRRIQAIESR